MHHTPAEMLKDLIAAFVLALTAAFILTFGRKK